MTPLLARVLTDENVHPDVVAWLRVNGSDVATTLDRHLNGRPDSDLLAAAYKEQRTFITHDRDFGRLAILEGAPSHSIIYLRPGHLSSAPAIRALVHLSERSPAEFLGPVIVVARAVDDRTHVRIRSLAR